MVQFFNHGNIQRTIADIKTQFHLSDGQVSENTLLLGLLGQSGTVFMTQIYATAALLSVLVLLAGILMIASSLNSNIAARSPAKKASQVSPLTAVSGRANETAPARKAANTALLKVDTALGIHHAKAHRKNFLLVTGSFALSIILFLSFSVTIDFMGYAINTLQPWTPDLSVISPDDTCSIDSESLKTLKENPVIKRAYGRMFAYAIPASVNGMESTTDLISYDHTQFEWAKKYLIAGSLKNVEEKNGTGIFVFTPSYAAQLPIEVGDIVIINNNGKHAEIEIAAIISKCPFDAVGSTTIICSEDTFRNLTGEVNYTIIDIQLTKKATDNDIAAVREVFDDAYTFSDSRMNNREVSGTYYSFILFLYGFLVLIAVITIFNIINCTSMSVSARMRQYGALRAIGLSHRQLSKMIIAETSTYALVGSIIGSVLGIFLNRLVFEKMVTYRWGAVWEIPAIELAIITGIVVFSVILAIRNPLQKIRKMSIVDTISV